jgi:hypothetical protein
LTMTKCIVNLLLLGHVLLVENIVSGLVLLANAVTKRCPSQHALSLDSLEDHSRRGFFVQQLLLLFGATLSLDATASSAAAAQQEDEGTAARRGEARGGRPYAPLEALVPATRCKVWIDQAHDISVNLRGTSDKDSQYNILLQMNQTLANRPKLFLVEKIQQQRGPPMAQVAQITTKSSVANKQQFQLNRAGLSIPDQLAAVFNQADVERQWGIIKYSESKREQANEIRAAFNFYTSQLTYADFYVLTASQEDKKRMVRNDQLPSLTSVIASDLDLRDLYRNEVLTAIEDVKAEVGYQLGRAPDLDPTDVIDLMDQAHSACTKWFDLIAQVDRQEALQKVLGERE